MTRFSGILGCIVLLSASLCSQPKIALEKQDIDLGVMYRGDVRKTSFKVKNIGNQPLKILQVVPSCGCTALKKPKEVLQPGEEDTVMVEFSSAAFRGRVEHKRIDIMSNDPVAEYVFVNLTADVREELVPVENGPSLLWFGTVTQGKTSELKITYENISGRTITIRNVAVSNPRVRVAKELSRLKPHDTVEFVVTITADKEGYTSDHIDLETDSPNQSKVTINVSFIGLKGS